MLRPSLLPLWPGRTARSEAKLKELLEKDGKEHHIFMENNIFHNHLAHHILTAWSVGASPSLLDQIYHNQARQLAPLDPTKRKELLEPRGIKIRTDIPEINDQNWTEFLGVSDAYAAYLIFFLSKLEKDGVEHTLERYIFSPAANSGGKSNQQGPAMLIRLLGGVVHPFIHVGFGAEFSFLGPLMLAEGLAETAVHSSGILGLLFPDNYPSDEETMLEGEGQGEGVTALEAYRAFIDDPEVVVGEYDKDKMINTRLKDAIKHGNAGRIQKHVDDWASDRPSSLGGKDSQEAWVQKKTEELLVFGSFLACATGKVGREIRVDFFLMHILTSSMFMPAYLPLLSYTHQVLLLKTYFAVALHTSLSRGRPLIDARVPWSKTEFPVKPGKENLQREGNGWTEVVGEGLFAPEPHTIKSLRSLLYTSTLLGMTPAGCLPGSHLKNGEETFGGMSEVDGSIFVRMAGMVLDFMKWNGPEAESADWDMTALGWEEAWERANAGEGKADGSGEANK